MAMHSSPAHCQIPANPVPIVFENGTIVGSIHEPNNSNTNARITRKNPLIIPEIVISASYSSNSLNRSRCDVSDAHNDSQDDASAERTALLNQQTSDTNDDDDLQQEHQQYQRQDEAFEQFVMNRTTSESNMLDSSIYSELHFTPSIGNNNISSGGPTATPQRAAPQTPPTATELLNSSACSRESRQAKRTRRKHKSKTKCSGGTTAPRATPALGTNYPPQYTAIFLDPHHHHHHHGGATVNGGGAANAMGQLATAAAASPFLNANVGDAAFLHQQYQQYYQQRPLMGSLNGLGHHHHHSALLDPTAVSLAVSTDGSAATSNGLLPGSGGGVGGPLATATATVNPPLRLSFRKWFSRPSLPFVIGILALGGVACTLGGIVLGSTGLIEHSTQYLSAALLMIGIGVSLLVISGAIWRLSMPDESDECPCYRHMETCRTCNSPYCNNRLVAGSYLYPEFQHRPPPPSYLTSLNECAAMGYLFHPAAQAQQVAYNTMRMNTPPPLYRSTNSLSVFVPGSLATSASISNPPNTTTALSSVPTLSSSGGILQDHNALTMSSVMENLQNQTQALTKEINYLELD